MRSSTRRCGRRSASDAGRRRRLRPDRVLPAVRRLGAAQRLGPGRQLRLVAGFGEGSIGYDEYAYALDNDIPVVKVLNPAGYYSLPTASNVAIALQAAVIDENPTSLTFLMQNLDDVYTNQRPADVPAVELQLPDRAARPARHQRQRRRAAAALQHATRARRCRPG